MKTKQTPLEQLQEMTEQVGKARRKSPRVRRDPANKVEKDYKATLKALVRQLQQEIESGERVIVGVNEFQVEDDEKAEDIEEVSEEDARRQREAVAELREERDEAAVEEALDGLRRACEGDENVMPHIVRAVKAYATVGEVCDTMRDTFGEYRSGV